MMKNDLLMRMIDLALQEVNAAKYSLEWKTATGAEHIDMNAHEFAVTVDFEARTEDTDFEVGVTSDTNAMLYNMQTCNYKGETGWGNDLYTSQAVVLHKGGMSIAVAGTPAPTFLLNYIKATITEYATD